MDESKIKCPTCKQTLDFEYCSNPLHLFPDMRRFTEEEAMIHKNAISNLGKPTGRKLFDLMDEDDDKA